jgi:hypothetical protein
MVKRKRINNNLQNISHKTKDQVTRTPLKTDEIINFSIVSKLKLFYIYNRKDPSWVSPAFHLGIGIKNRDLWHNKEWFFF